MKASPRDLIRAHYRTFRNDKTEKPSPADYAVFWGVPLLFGAASLLLDDLDLPAGASIALVTTSGLLSAFFFGVTLQLLERAMEWAEHPPRPTKETSWRANFLEEIAASAGYASLASIATAAAFVVALIAHGHQSAIFFSSVALALAVHLMLLLSMVVVRIFALTKERLDEARVGGADGSGNVTALPERRETG